MLLGYLRFVSSAWLRPRLKNGSPRGSEKAQRSPLRVSPKTPSAIAAAQRLLEHTGYGTEPVLAVPAVGRLAHHDLERLHQREVLVHLDRVPQQRRVIEHRHVRTVAALEQQLEAQRVGPLALPRQVGHDVSDMVELVAPLIGRAERAGRLEPVGLLQLDVDVPALAEHRGVLPDDRAGGVAQLRDADVLHQKERAGTEALHEEVDRLLEVVDRVPDVQDRPAEDLWDVHG